MKALKAKKQILRTQISNARTRNNERQLERALQRYFKALEKQVQRNLKFYWQDNLVMGQVDLITEPITNTHQEYYEIIEKYLLREYELGSQEAKRLVLRLNKNRVANKSIIDPKLIKSSPIISSIYDLFGTLSDAEDDLLTRTFEASMGTLMRVDQSIKEIITDGYKTGYGINYVSNKIRERFGQLHGWESKRIARTEIHNAHNRAVIDTYNEYDVQYTMWISAHDKRVRGLKKTDKADHVKLDGEIIRLGDTYSNGLKYPGDTDGPLVEWINCRCSNAPFVVPYGFMAPSFSPFRESDLIKVETKPITTQVNREFVTDVDGSIMAEQDKEQLKIDYLDNEKAAVRNYGFSSDEINGFLYKTPYMRRLVGSISDRTQKRRFLGKINHKVKLIEAAIDKSPRLVKDTKLYRAGPLPEGLKVGDRGVFDGFTSVTFSEKIARGFLNKPTRYLYSIESPTGTKGIRINGQLNCSNAEDELLLQLKQEFDVINIDHEKKEILIRLVN